MRSRSVSVKEKSAASHTLVMSATPIPRTLAHVLYGDLSLSKIDENTEGEIAIIPVEVKYCSVAL